MAAVIRKVARVRQLILADFVVVLGKGCVRWTGTSEELRKADQIRHTWLGI